MKVLHISDTEYEGGSDAVFRDTIKACDMLGYRSYKFTSSKDRGVFSYIFSSKYYSLLRKKLYELSPDIIHIHCYYHYLTPSILLAIRRYKMNNKVRVIFTAHDYHLIFPNSGLQTFNKGLRRNICFKHRKISLFDKFDYRGWGYSNMKLLQRLINYNLLKLNNVFDFIISPSLFLKTTFTTYGVKTPIYLIRNPINLSENLVIRKKVADNEVIKIVICARLNPEKGIYEFIRKLNSYDNYKIEVNIFGDGEEKERIKSISLQSNVSVTFHGSVKRELLTRKISNYDIFALPSIWYENAPISIIEAADAGLPILVPNVGGLREMAMLTEHYELYEEDDNLLEKILLLKKNSSINKLKSPKTFSHEHYQEKIKEIYCQKD